MTGVVFNPRWSRVASAGAPAVAAPFHRSLPGYAPSPLVAPPELAAALGVGAVLVKDESSRLGLGSFKGLGASWAAHVELCRRVGLDPATTTLQRLRAALAVSDRPRPRLIAASAGNHGLALAWFARQAGLAGRILLPAGTVPERVRPIESQDAEVVTVDGDYEDAVRAAAAMADADNLVIADTSWDGYEAVPHNVVDGYATLMAEVDQSIEADGLPRPTTVVAPVGVGSLATAVVRGAGGWPGPPAVVSVEPAGADCLAVSVAVGEMANAGPAPATAMAGLNCAELSPIAWPELRDGVRACLTVTDAEAAAGAELLHRCGVAAGPSGSAGAGALLAADPQTRATVGAGRADTVLLLVTEGVV